MIKKYPTLKNLAPLFFLLFSIIAFSQTSQTFTTSGTFTVPAGVTQLTVEAWGGGGAGGGVNGSKYSAGGGGGGAYTIANSVIVTPGQIINFTVGSGGIGYLPFNETSTGNGGNGGTSTFLSVIANGGNGGNGVPNNNSVGLGGAGGLGGTYSGGSGSTGVNSTNAAHGGGGGSSAGTTLIGENAINSTGAIAPIGGGNGGNGGSASGQGSNGSAGAVPGGGGGGGSDVNNAFVSRGGAGGNGQIILRWTCPTYSLTSTVVSSPVCKGGKATVTLNGSAASLPRGIYTVTYNQSAPNPVTGATQTMTVTTAGTGTFTTNVLTNPGSTTITVTNLTSGGCSSTISANNTASVVVTDQAGAAGAITGSATVCQGQSNVAYSVPAIANATSYTWVYSGIGATISGTTNNILINFVANATSGNLTVRGTNACGDGTISANYAITVNPLPATPGAITVSAAQCPSLTSQVYSISNVADATTYTWEVPTGWSITHGQGTTSITVSIGSAGQDGNITVSAQNFCASTVQTLAVTGKTINYWNGADTVWNNAANWSVGVPSGSNKLDIVIPVVPSGKYPLLSDDISINNIEIQNDALLNVLNNGLTITGDLILNGKINLHGESQLIQEMTSSLIICNNSLGTIEIDQQGTGNSFRYNYWSSPVNSMGSKYTIDEVLRDGNGGTLANKNISYGAAYTFADGAASVSPAFIKLSSYWMYVLRNSGAGYSAWFRVGNTGEISVGEGYTMKGSNTSAAEQNYTFVGKPNNGDITLPLTANFNYLVGNPYPSAIDADQFLNDNSPSGTASITGTIYYWEHYGGDTHNLAGYQAGYATYNLGSGVPAASHPNVSSVGSSVKGAPQQYIPVGQAFFVVGDADGGDILFNNGQRVFKKESLGEAIFMKNSSTKAKTENTRGTDLRPKFRIGFDAPKINHRQLLLTIDERATPAVDWGFDAEIYEIFADDMYWMLNNKKYVIQGTNAIGLNSEVPLGIQLSKTGMVTVKIDELENVDDDTSIYLKDKLTGESFNMRDKPVQLNLTAGKYADRFVLVFKTQKLMAEDVKTEVLIPALAQPIIEGIYVFMNNAISELQIKNNSPEEITSVTLINTLGQTVKTWNSNFNIRTISLPISTATGVYLVQINTKTGKIVKKISVQ